MKVEIIKQAAKYFKEMNEPAKSRMKDAFNKLRKDPPEGDIKKLEGKKGFRVRVGDYRILFVIENTAIIVYKIAPRGQAYK
jgi:mRNA interferase RelE/StbE